jgi:hypothetical protein
MLTFKSFEDVDRQLLQSHSGYKLVKELCHHFMVGEPDDGITYDPEADGYLILLEEQDMGKTLTSIWPDDPDSFTLADIPWESWSSIDHFYVGVYLANNQYGLVFVVDKSIPDYELRKVIRSHL